jgi:hypothetical protein
MTEIPKMGQKRPQIGKKAPVKQGETQLALKFEIASKPPLLPHHLAHLIRLLHLPTLVHATPTSRLATTLVTTIPTSLFKF